MVGEQKGAPHQSKPGHTGEGSRQEHRSRARAVDVDVLVCLGCESVALQMMLEFKDHRAES